MRLDKWLSNSGFGSRKDVKQLIKSGAVTINGTAVKDGKKQAVPGEDKVAVHGEEIVYREFIYLMMNKPDGVISATEDNFHETVIDLIDEYFQSFKPFPVGRLDIDTEGLLLLTNDGQLSHSLLSPKKHVPKKYYAEIDGAVTGKDAEAFSCGVELDDGYVTKPAVLEILEVSGERSKINLTISEGKFHQVKRMFLSRGKEVTYLKRMKMGRVDLDPILEPGEYRELTKAELESLLASGVSEH
ncbi:pseudouridine synthase [Fictibacillus aquaticus]|uniref:Pseudouridine synthase n=1 Tax=Fictibacillus aquaticus TaxID=2021314 RepID=A0A235FAE1_9BACL|nr:pseudouridine synthase [Fictibacillus aquaticus]OYD58266.1 16S rRNA pseudouridine(516) synthase [Fictibacillus aquaticus]